MSLENLKIGPLGLRKEMASATGDGDNERGGTGIPSAKGNRRRAIEDEALWSIFRSGRIAREVLSRNASTQGTTLVALSVLGALVNKGTVSSVALRKSLGLTASTFNDALHDLNQQELVKIDVSSIDRRAQTIAITWKGETFADKAAYQRRRLLEGVFRGVSDEDLIRLAGILSRIP